MGGWHLRMTWSQEFCSASLHSEPASALGSPTVWSLWGNLGVARCQEMSTLPAGYIPKHKGTWASSSGLLGFHCVWSVVGWLIVHQDDNYPYPVLYSRSQIGWYRLLVQEPSHGKTQYIPGKQVLVRSWLWKNDSKNIFCVPWPSPPPPWLLRLLWWFFSLICACFFLVCQ